MTTIALTTIALPSPWLAPLPRAWSERDPVRDAFAAMLAPSEAPRDPGEAQVRAWVSAAQRGDPEGARLLYEVYASKVFRVVRGSCRSDAEAEDVTQETFARAYEALETYVPRDGVRFVSWLLRIATNVARKSRRGQLRVVVTEPAAFDTEAESETATAAELIDRQKLRAALLEGLAELEVREREVVSLRYGAELDASEIATATGLTHAHVRKILQRAREALREHIDRSLAPAAPRIARDIHEKERP